MTAQLPNESQPNEPASDSALALVGVSLCEASTRLHAWSITLLWVTFISGVLQSPDAGVLLLMAALVPTSGQVYFAWRIAFDRPIFAAWAQLRDDEHKAAQRAYDIALSVLLKKNVSAERDRSMSDRVMGVRRLHTYQIVALLGQVLVLLVGMIIFLIVLNRFLTW